MPELGKLKLLKFCTTSENQRSAQLSELFDKPFISLCIMRLMLFV